MSMTRLFHVIGKLFSFCTMAGFSVAHAIKMKRLERGGSWVKRTRYAGVVARIRVVVGRLVIATFIVLAVLVVITSF